jgi:hypothetical protein
VPEGAKVADAVAGLEVEEGKGAHAPTEAQANPKKTFTMRQ